MNDDDRANRITRIDVCTPETTVKVEGYDLRIEWGDFNASLDIEDCGNTAAVFAGGQWTRFKVVTRVPLEDPVAPDPAPENPFGDFAYAAISLIDGLPIRRRVWIPGFWVRRVAGELPIDAPCVRDERGVPYQFDQSDIFADDWEILYGALKHDDSSHD